MRKTINVNLYPRDGYFFKDADGAVIRATDWPKVKRKVAAYRTRAGRPVGNVDAEVDAQACMRNPAHCAEISDATLHQTKVSSMKGRVLQYLSFIRGLIPGNRLPWANPRDAANRAAVCASCPNNTALPEGCSSCRAAVREMQKEILGGRTLDARLNGCCVLGESLPVSVWVDHDVVDSAELPPHCWRKRRTP
jgi:hypothetical protein